MLHVPIEAVGVISSLPDLATLVSLPLAALLADYLRANKIMSIQNVSTLFLFSFTFVHIFLKKLYLYIY